MIDISGLDKADVLMALYNASKAQGRSWIRFDFTPMAKSEAIKIIARGSLDFDYINGRVMKVDLSGDELEPGLYDRDNGPGAAERALRDLLASRSRPPQSV